MRTYKLVRVLAVVLILSAAPMLAQSVKLAWDAPVDMTGIDGYEVYRTQTAGQYPPENAANTVHPATGMLPINQLNFEDFGVSYGQTYFYVIKSVHSVSGAADIRSLPSNEVTAPVNSPQATPIPVITQAKCTTGNGRRIDLIWTIASPATSSNVRAQYTNETNPSNFIIDVMGTTNPTAVLTVTSGREVTIWVTAVGPAGLSPVATTKQTCFASPNNARIQ